MVIGQLDEIESRKVGLKMVALDSFRFFFLKRFGKRIEIIIEYGINILSRSVDKFE